MRSSTTFALLFTLSAASLLAVSSASANGVPTRTQSAYGDVGSTILSTGSFLTGGVSVAEQSFCSASDSDLTDGLCALSFAYQLPATLPAGAIGLTISVPVPSGASLLSTSPPSFGILTNDDGGDVTGGNVFFSPSVSEAQLLALGVGEITYGTEDSNTVAFLTITDLSQIPDGGDSLAFFMDVGDNSNGDGSFCSDKGDTKCTFDLPSGIPEPDVIFKTAAAPATPEPGTLLSLFPALGLLGLYRRRSKS